MKIYTQRLEDISRISYYILQWNMSFLLYAKNKTKIYMCLSDISEYVPEVSYIYTHSYIQ